MIAASARILTATSPGAIGVVRISGPGALAAACAIFHPNRGQPLSPADVGRPRFGRVGGGFGDEVVVLVLEGDEPVVEIHGHGGPAALASIVGELAAHGVAIEPEHAEDRPEDLLARAATLRVASLLLDQCGGAFDRERERLNALRSLDPEAANSRALALLALAEFGLRLDRGWTVALGGRPNVGKSRLLNAIAGFDRAIVSAVAGTTRDVVSARLAIDGWPVVLLDTAGTRDAAHELEAEGIARGREARSRSDLAVIVLDRSRDLSGDDLALLADHPHALRVASKSDLPAAWDEADQAALAVSAATGDGLTALLAAIASRLVPSVPESGSLIPVLPEQVAWLERFGGLEHAS